MESNQTPAIRPKRGPSRWTQTVAACLLSSALAASAPSVRAATQSETKIALIIGESRYEDSNMELRTPGNDAQDIGDAFRKNGFEVTARSDLTHDDFRRELADFAARAVRADVVVFYFAGHGVQYRDKNYLVPIDMTSRRPEDLPSSAIAVNEVIDTVSGARKAKFVIFDACRDAAPDTPVVSRADPPETASAGGATTRSLTELSDAAGLARIDGAHGLVVYFSQQHGKLASDSIDESRNSPFAAALKKRLVGPQTPVLEMFNGVAGDVYQATSQEQEPEIVTASLAFASPSDEIKWGAYTPPPAPAPAPIIRQYIARPAAPAPVVRAEKAPAYRPKAPASGGGGGGGGGSASSIAITNPGL